MSTNAPNAVTAFIESAIRLRGKSTSVTVTEVDLPRKRIALSMKAVTAFGAFVDIGGHQDGLVHVSQLSDRFIKDPSEVVKVAQRGTVTVTEVDLPRKRIALSMKAAPVLGASTSGTRTSQIGRAHV